MSKQIEIIQEVMPDLSRVTLPESDVVDLDYLPGDYIQIEMKVVRGKKNKRNLLMNRCVHKYCSMLADLLNNRGLDMAVFFAKYKQGEPVNWTMNDVKERIFKPTLKGVAQTDKTSQASNAELCEVDEKLGKFFSENEDIQVIWPSNQPPAWSSNNE